ncbi:type II toxin-antitoxin system RelE/ParE family toxin [Hansschlegelia zhihuaiae]|uniref:Type II toxin-antitoxin system RelE/ParE family toxin n=1 Tax=Hansschlegelia zhihuaiae TaxID=405005 RepID=A0A4V1KJJ2_9HYPH|nr:type II toxin-antitoxin system RelE/ParE family toxin [Hansschlegelia zhihuaiae]RXF74382.1 type II toxin-antitoxin system RelE/ParE family toxin [Hansschlegelia zhihuaiae]
MKLVLSQVADADVGAILRETFRVFGPAQVDVYAALIDRALTLVADDPFRPSSIDRSSLYPGARSLHVGIAATRLRGASHVAFYLAPTERRRVDEVYVIRVLHQAMDPEIHLIEGLRSLSLD